MSIVKRCTQYCLALFFRLRGYSSYMSQSMVRYLYDDVVKNTTTTFSQKLWAYKRGFFSDKIEYYGLTDENYIDYISDFDYMKLHPINGKYSRWIDDKLTTYYILSPFREYLPRYFYQIMDGGNIVKLPDCPKDLPSEVRGIITLLGSEKNLALKLVSGSLGVGFYHLSLDEDGYHVDGVPTSEEALADFLNSLRDYLVTEYIISHPYIRKYYSGAPNTARVAVINTDGLTPIVLNAFIRFGTSQTGSVDNVAMGGILCTVDVKTGKFSKPLRKQNQRLVELRTHPDSGEILEGVLPNWEIIKSKLIEMSQYTPQLKYQGFDVVVTEDSFKILEINSHQDLIGYQSYYPLLADELSSGYFKLLLKK